MRQLEYQNQLLTVAVKKNQLDQNLKNPIVEHHEKVISQQSVAINDLKSLVQQTLKVKIKYENIISLLVNDPETHDKAVEAIREVQSKLKNKE